MDDSQIFVKTAAGEQAIQERTRLVQRNLRMVLILVEGQTTVGALKAKVADGTIVEAGLAELQQMGLIEPLDARRRRETTVASAGQEATVEDTAGDVHMESPQGTADLSPQIPSQEQAIGPIGNGAEARPEPPTQGIITAGGLLGAPTGPHGADEDLRPPKFRLRLPSRISGFPRVQVERFTARREEREFEQAYVEETPPTVKLRPVKRGPRRRIGWLGATGLLLLGLIIGGAVVLALFPFDSYRPNIESQAGRLLLSPVRIGDVHLVLTPYPNLTLDHVLVGEGNSYAEIGAVRIVPDLFTVFSATPGVQKLEFAGVKLHAGGLDRVARWFGRGSTGPVPQRFLISDLSLDAALGNLVSGYSGEGVFRADGSLAALNLHNAEGTIDVEAEPSGGVFRIALAGGPLKTPLRPGTDVVSIDAKGELAPQQLRLPKVVAQVYDGLLEGSATLDWSNGVSVLGDGKLKHASIGRLLREFDTEAAFEGEIDVQAHFESRTRRLEGLFEASRIDGSFTATRALLNRFDLVEAVRAPGRQTIRSGSTRVDQLTGKLQCDGRACRIGDLQMSSGLMRAGGRMSIARSDAKLEGLVEVEMSGTANNVRAPVAISGTLGHPELVRRAAP